jgi:hypothetical protein
MTPRRGFAPIGAELDTGLSQEPFGFQPLPEAVYEPGADRFSRLLPIELGEQEVLFHADREVIAGLQILDHIPAPFPSRAEDQVGPSTG